MCPSKTMLLSIAVAASCAVVHASSPQATSQTATAVVAKAAPVPLLWKVSDADNSLYLLGSFHFLKGDDYPLAPEVDAAFDDAERLVFEVAPEEMSSPELAAEMTMAALRIDGTALNDDLPPGTVARLDAWLAANAVVLQRYGLAPQTLQKFESWYVALIIAIVEFEKFGLDRKLGFEAHFAAAALEAGKPAVGFETGSQQIAFFDGMSKQEQLQFLGEALEDSEKGRQAIEKLHNAWRNGDAATLWSDMAADLRKQSPALYQRINVERNDAWLPQLEQRLKESTTDDTLVVVGSLHLLGGDGVVEKLRAKGYTVERVCSACKPAK
jgi:hypothetical protein